MSSMQTVFSMVATAVMLSLAGAGGMSNPEAFQPVWAMMLAQQMMVVVLVLSLPKSRVERNDGFERISAEDDTEETEETNTLLGGEDGEDDKSIYRRTAEQTTSS